VKPVLPNCVQPVKLPVSNPPLTGGHVGAQAFGPQAVPIPRKRSAPVHPLANLAVVHVPFARQQAPRQVLGPHVPLSMKKPPSAEQSLLNSTWQLPSLPQQAPISSPAQARY